jgi:uncharacterized protein YcbX
MQIGTVQLIWRHPVKSMAGEQLKQCTVGPLGIPGDRGWALRDESTHEITNGKRIPLLMQCAARYLTEPQDLDVPPVEIKFPNGEVITSDETNVNERLSKTLGKQVTLWPRQPPEDLDHYRRRGANARIVGSLSRNRTFRSLLPTLTKLSPFSGPLREMFSRNPDEPVPDISLLPPEVLEFTSPLGTYFDAYPINILATASLEAMARFNPNALWDSRRFRPNFLIETNGEIQGLVEPIWEGRTLRFGTVEIRCDLAAARCGMTTHAQEGIPKDPSVLRSIVREANQNLGVYANVVKPGRVALGDAVELV